MFTKTRNTLVASVAALSLAVGFVGAAEAHSTTSPDKITIHYNGDGFDGQVQSSKAKCLSNRSVQVHNGKGRVLYTTTTNTDGSWDNGNSGQAHGKFFATVNSKGACLPLVSKTITLP
jgi:hypothetical protein